MSDHCFKSDWAVFQPKANSSTSIELHPVSNIIHSFLAIYLHQSSSVDLALPSAAVETTKSMTDIVITGRQNVVYMSCVYLFAKHVLFVIRYSVANGFVYTDVVLIFTKLYII